MVEMRYKISLKNFARFKEHRANLERKLDRLIKSWDEYFLIIYGMATNKRW